ncbi:hypothetical protein [Salininema proteolyticum]|uniref:Uncharacterized protein n=1 Tax=Salininema proteolyticum TaxID=1607685 RepID=A0ABV8U333_9ACTN
MDSASTNWFASLARTAVGDASATLTASDGADTVYRRSRHDLRASDLTRWRYEVESDGETTVQYCDGITLDFSMAGRTSTTPVPSGEEPDDPLFFYSWIGVVDTWLVEMLRPAELLSRLEIASIAAPQDGEVHIDATPLGNEPSPYSGIALPDGRRLELLFDTERMVCHTARATLPPVEGTTTVFTYTVTNLMEA